MSEAWSQWEGQVIDGRFELKQCLGASGQSAVYLTQICSRDQSGPEPIPLAIKLIAADPAHAGRQLSRWRLAQILSHPNLLRVFDAGRCRLGNTDLIFGVLEYADENLAQIIPQRPITAEEARLLLEPALEALAYLHEQGLVHGGLKPANVMAMGNDIKLASDWISPAKEAVSDPGIAGVYDAPETGHGTKSPAADVWSLGMVLAEALTQRLPSSNGRSADKTADPLLPGSLPAPFAEIVRGCLRCDVNRRLTVAEIATLLHGGTRQASSVPAVVMSTAASADSGGSYTPVITVDLPAVQQTPTPAPKEAPAPKKPSAAETVPVTKKVVVSSAAAPPRVAPSAVVKPRVLASQWRQPSPAIKIALPARDALLNWISWIGPLIRRFALPLAVAIAALGVLYAALGLIHRNSAPADSSSAKTEQHAAPAMKPQPASLRSGTKPSPRVGPNSGGRAGVVPDKKPDPAGAQGGTASVAAGSQDSGVVQQALPRASQSALDTIQGTVKVSVKVKIDSAGNVTEADLVSTGPSQYFARLSLEAARAWKFDPNRAAGHPFLLHFEFRNSGTQAYATRAGS